MSFDQCACGLDTAGNHAAGCPLAPQTLTVPIRRVYTESEKRIWRKGYESALEAVARWWGGQPLNDGPPWAAKDTPDGRRIMRRLQDAIPHPDVIRNLPVPDGPEEA